MECRERPNILKVVISFSDAFSKWIEGVTEGGASCCEGRDREISPKSVARLMTVL
jgi:hypothetical protein